MKKCPYCKQEIPDGAIKCFHCGSMLPPEQQGYSQQQTYQNQYQNQYGQQPYQPYGNQNYSNNPFDEGPEGKSRGVCALLAILLGGLGVQYFYLGNIWGGIITIILSMVTCGIWQVLMLIQGILMFCMSNETFRQKYVLSCSTLPLF